MAVADQNERRLNIDAFFDGSQLAGKRALVIGANGGLGLEVARVLKQHGADCTGTVRAAAAATAAGAEGDHCTRIIGGVDVTTEAGMEALRQGLAGQPPLDMVIVVAGYFAKDEEPLDALNFEEEKRMIDICGLGPLRVASTLVNAGLVASDGGKIAIVTSQAGSIAWREAQNPHGGHYGHHMSRACTNMMGRLLSFELKPKGIAVALLHPSFVRTSMTKRFEALWDKEGAVEADVAAKRVLHEVSRLSLATSGSFINCEDGLLIPW